jgi:hypothetical protein
MHPPQQYIHECHIKTMLRVPISYIFVEIASPVALDYLVCYDGNDDSDSDRL